MRGDNVIYTLINGKMTKIYDSKNPERANFVIVCSYGDWSGFRTLANCERQFGELESAGRPNHYYQVVERN